MGWLVNTGSGSRSEWAPNGGQVNFGRNALNPEESVEGLARSSTQRATQDLASAWSMSAMMSPTCSIPTDSRT